MAPEKGSVERAMTIDEDCHITRGFTRRLREDEEGMP